MIGNPVSNRLADTQSIAQGGNTPLDDSRSNGFMFHVKQPSIGLPLRDIR